MSTPPSLLDQTKPFVRMAIVGCGNIARSHLNAIARNYRTSSATHSQIGVTCLCDPSETQRTAFQALVQSATGLQPLCFDSLDAALAQACDAFDTVNICVPNDLHEKLALQAFNAGKHVLLEKPIALNVASAERILAAAAEAKTVFMVAENAQYWKEILVVHRCLQAETYGKVVSVRAKCWETIVNQNEWQGDYAPGLWRSDPSRAGGGFVFDSASHWFVHANEMGCCGGRGREE